MKKPPGNILQEVSVDCVMFGFHADQLKVLLVKWNKKDLGLPRGSIFKKEQISESATRVLKETTGIQDIFLQQFHTFGVSGKGPKRKSANALFPESLVSIGFYALVDFERIKPDSSGSFSWYEITEIPELLFDHNDMIEMALVALRKDLRYLPIAKLLPQKFTLREMQKLYEIILNREFDRRNFHKLLMSYDFLIKLPEKKTGTANKSPHLYQIDPEKYETALQDGISY